MNKCKLSDKEDTKCLNCIVCLYKEDKKRRPWIYEESLNKAFFGRDMDEEVVEKQKTLFDF